MLFAPLCRCPFLGRHLPVGMSNAQQETKPTTTSTNFFKRTHTNSLTSSVAKIKTLKENNKRNEKRVSRQRVLHTLERDTWVSDAHAILRLHTHTQRKKQTRLQTNIPSCHSSSSTLERTKLFSFGSEESSDYTGGKVFGVWWFYLNHLVTNILTRTHIRKEITMMLLSPRHGAWGDSLTMKFGQTIQSLVYDSSSQLFERQDGKMSSMIRGLHIR